MKILNINVAIIGGLPLNTIHILANNKVFSWDSLTGEVKLVKDLSLKGVK